MERRDYISQKDFPKARTSDGWDWILYEFEDKGTSQKEITRCHLGKRLPYIENEEDFEHVRGNEGSRIKRLVLLGE